MAIVVGDIHGNVEKIKMFLAYKPDQGHVVLGDYLDSFFEPQNRQIVALQMLLSSAAVLLWGNHDLHYLRNPPWRCTGFQHGEEARLTEIIESNKYRFKAAHTVDGWLCTHAGVHVRLAKRKNEITIADRLNGKMAQYLATISRPGSIFAIGSSRGGPDRAGGIFWFDFQRENGLDVTIKQLFGHTETKEPVVTETYVALDTTNNKNNCWVYDTTLNELVAVPIPRHIPLISDLPEGEQGPFSEFLLGQTVPSKDGYYEGDYARWKRGQKTHTK